MTDLMTSVEPESRLGRLWWRRGQVRTYRPAWQGRSLAEGRAGVDTVSKGSTRGFSAVVLALQVSEQWEQTAYVILGREREGRRLQRSRPQGVSKRELEAGQKRGLQTWRDAKQKQMTFLFSSYHLPYKDSLGLPAG